MTGSLLQLFLKAPLPGSVKTRLAASVGPEKATAIYRQLVERQLQAVEDAGRIEIHYAPADAGAEMQNWLGEHYTYIPQPEGDLGDRMAHAVQGGFIRGATTVFCLGGDCPHLNSEALHAAETLLDQGHDSVFGPSEDGGYYLLAQRAYHPELFTDIPWSTTDTLAVSLDHAQKANRNPALLPTGYDVDTEADWQRAVKEGLIGPLHNEQRKQEWTAQTQENLKTHTVKTVDSSSEIINQLREDRN
jgi:rSAM/selenodomain-associated transferase 1